MSLLRTALALSLLLGTSAQEPHKLHQAKKHLRHHKHHGHHKQHSAGLSQLWSHGQKFELVLPESEDAGLVKLARKAVQSENPSLSAQMDRSRAAAIADPTVETQSRPAKVPQTAPDNAGQQVDDQQPMAQEAVDATFRMQETEKARWAKAYAREVRKIQNKDKVAKEAATVAKASNEPVAKEAVTVAKVPETQEDEVNPKQIAIKVSKVSAALKTATDQKSQHEDDQSHGTMQASATSNTQAQEFAKIRQELRLAKKKDHQVKVLNKHLDAELDILFKSSELQKSVKSDEQSAKLMQQQTSQLKTMAEQTKMRISESKEVAHNAARLAAQQAEALRDAARAEEKKAEEQLQNSKKAELEADKLDKIALKELRKLESKPKGAWIQENATVAN